MAAATSVDERTVSAGIDITGTAGAVDAKPKSFAELQPELRELMRQQAAAVVTREQAYVHENVKGWITQINDGILSAARSLCGESTFKFMVSTVIAQRSGAGLKIQASAYWDPSTDGSLVVTVDSPAMVAISTLFACAI